MEKENAIEIKDIKKKFKIYYDKGKMLKERIINVKRNRYEEHWVLKGISFTVKKGEAVGLIGHNGCGKSTTLKLLTGIMYPDSGNIKMNGRVSSLLELGAGFHPDMSGRENIYINASIFGMNRKEIEKRISRIIEFSELEKYIDNPVRTYSSGMYMRLAFSVAVNVDADILLIDEILAVGDVNFQAKCFHKMMEIKQNGTTIIFVSHSLGQVEQICDKSIWIQEGLVKEIGEPREVHQKYLEFMGEIRKENSHETEQIKSEEEQKEKLDTIAEEREAEAEEQKGKHRGTGEAIITSVTTWNKKNEAIQVFSSEETIIFKIKYKVYKKIENVLIGLSIFRIDDVRCYGTNTRADGLKPFILERDGEVQLIFEQNQLLQGNYFVDACITVGMDDMVDYYSHIGEFEVYNTKSDIGVIRMSHKWEFK